VIRLHEGQSSSLSTLIRLIVQDNVSSIETVLNPWPIIHGCLIVYSCSLGAVTPPQLSPQAASATGSASTSPSGPSPSADWKSLEVAKAMLKNLRKKEAGQSKKATVVLVGNKCDLAPLG